MKSVGAVLTTSAVECLLVYENVLLTSYRLGRSELGVGGAYKGATILIIHGTSTSEGALSEKKNVAMKDNYGGHSHQGVGS